MKNIILTAALAFLAATTSAMAQQKTKVDPALLQSYIASSFKGASPEWQARIVPDETLRVCSEYRNDLPQKLFAEVQAREQAAIVYPADGVFIGDWKKGQALAQRGTGGQFSDKPDGPKGGNCYACHQLSPQELSFGTIGPSLREYGKIRKFDPVEAKAAYAKIYNAQAVQPCSLMPRFGHNKFLNEQEMKDLTAYLFDPLSPVNK